MFFKWLINSDRTAAWLVLALLLASCDRAQEETIAGVNIPVPPGMSKAHEREAALSVPGFSGGQASFQGKIKPKEVIDFYRREMTSRGWRSSVSVISRGGVVSYTKEGQTLVITVVESNDGSSMTLVVGTAR